MCLTVVHCDAESSSIVVWLSHLSDFVGLFFFKEAKQKLARILKFFKLLKVSKIVLIKDRNHVHQSQEIDNLTLRR